MRNQEGIEVGTYQVLWNADDYDIPASSFSRILEEIYWYGVPGFELQNVVSSVNHITIYLTSPDKSLLNDWMQVASYSLGAEVHSLFVGLYESVPNDAGFKVLKPLDF